MWTNTTVKHFIDTYKHRISAIHLNNNKVIMIDYPGKYSTKLSDRSLETIGGVDLMVINHTDISSGKEVHYKTYVTTEFIEGIDVIDEADQEYRVDPLRFN